MSQLHDTMIFAYSPMRSLPDSLIFKRWRTPAEPHSRSLKSISSISLESKSSHLCFKIPSITLKASKTSSQTHCTSNTSSCPHIGVRSPSNTVSSFLLSPSTAQRRTCRSSCLASPRLVNSQRAFTDRAESRCYADEIFLKSTRLSGGVFPHCIVLKTRSKRAWKAEHSSQRLPRSVKMTQPWPAYEKTDFVRREHNGIDTKASQFEI